MKYRLPFATIAMVAAAPGGAVTARPAPVSAASPLAVTTRVMVEERRAAPDGTTRITLAKPTRVGPGDKIVVVVGYRNTGTQPLGNVVLADPLPPSILYRGARAGSPEPEVSVDGHSFAPLGAPPLAGSRPARADEVTAVRWRLSTPLAPGGQGELAFQGVVK